MKIPGLRFAFYFFMLYLLDWKVINKDRHLKALSVYMEAAHAARLFKSISLLLKKLKNFALGVKSRWSDTAMCDLSRRKRCGVGFLRMPSSNSHFNINAHKSSFSVSITLLFSAKLHQLTLTKRMWGFSLQPKICVWCVVIWRTWKKDFPNKYWVDSFLMPGGYFCELL